MFNKILPLIFVFVFFMGCSKTAMEMFSEDGVYQKGLEHTQVGDIVQSLETKAILNATYLNLVDEKKWSNENHNFLVGIYIANGDREFIENKDYNLKLNGNTYISAKEVLKTDNIYQHIPLKNPHAKYYFVTFNKDKQESLQLTYSNKTTGEVSLNFEVVK
jgi:hypothetical protein